MPKKVTLDELIRRSNEIHENKYDYSQITDYKKTSQKIPIVCPLHGVFYKTFTKHISSKQGCPKCANHFHYNTETFIERASGMEHCSNYTYEKSEFKTVNDKLIITCHVLDENGNEHGDFQITPGHLFDGEGCPKCRYVKSAAGRRRSIDEVVEAAKKVHGDLYDYSELKEYKNSATKYPIICRKHGVFYQTMNNHISQKQGCPVCSKENLLNNVIPNKIIPFEKFVELARQVHGDKYDYHDDSYIMISEKTRITCPNHGDFWQKPANHVMLGYGCPKCSHSQSNGEIEIINFLKTIFNENSIEERSRKYDNRYEIDVFIPSMLIGFEYDGLYWHSTEHKEPNYHLEKHQFFLDNNVNVYHIYEDEWKYKKEVVKGFIRTKLGMYETTLPAYLCYIQPIDKETSLEFFEKNCLQYDKECDISYGCYNGNNLVSVISFGSLENGKWKITGFTEKIGIHVLDIKKILINYFINEQKPKSLIVDVHLRLDNEKDYNELGFKRDGEIKINKYYGKGQIRYDENDITLQYENFNLKNVDKKTFDDFLKEKNLKEIYDCGMITMSYINQFGLKYD